ncbi:MAG TPA: MauE/DoxX family redox-associated membrane protein [Chitinophagales bacterium]|nr:MauE/DoxX family redox-associated membrane protein [Chitinophagales bacterium]
MKKYLIFSIRILLGGTFLLSACLKLFPIEPFELNFIDLGIANWITAPFIARLLIGTEFFLGVLLLFGLALKKFTLPATFILVALFSTYILFQLFTSGNKGDCGCFGTYLQMTPLQSLIKNVILVSLAVLLYLISEVKRIRFQNALIIFFAVAALSLPLLLNPIDLMAGKVRQPEEINFPLPITLITGESTKNDTIDLMKGKHIISFISLTCPHCKVAAFKMHVMKKRHPEIPFYFILNGKENKLQDFYDATKADNIDYMFLFGKNFYTLTGGNLPTIYWVDNGMVVKKSMYISLEEKEILQWLGEQ